MHSKITTTHMHNLAPLLWLRSHFFPFVNMLRVIVELHFTEYSQYYEHVDACSPVKSFRVYLRKKKKGSSNKFVEKLKRARFFSFLLHL